MPTERNTPVESSRRPRRWLAAIGATALASSLLTTATAQAVGDSSATDYGFVAKIDIDAPGGRACTGALIAQQWILTATSCFAEPNQDGQIDAGPPPHAATATVGRASLSDSGGHIVDITVLIPREDRDVTLAKLSTPVTDVPPVPVSSNTPSSGDKILVSGYGRTATEWVPDKAHTATFTVEGSTTSTFSLTADEGVDTCKGDAGGPAFREVDGSQQLVAISTKSWQHGCLGVDTTQQGSIEARVDNIAGWIREHTIPDTISCPNGAAVWYASSEGALSLYRHNQPESGGLSWVSPKAPIGDSWKRKMFAGPDGVVWGIFRNAGDLERWVWDGQSWSGGDTVDTGWQRYVTPEYRNRITVDSQGRIYTINEVGELRVHVWSTETSNWIEEGGKVIDTGWGRFDSITAAGDGVLYSRTPSGDLYRFSYNMASGQWEDRDRRIGSGWQVFSQIFSPGAEILYARGARGRNPWTGDFEHVLRWYQYDADTYNWYDPARDGAGKVVGTGWDTAIDVAAAPDSCTLS